jgi:dihydrofolate reductase
MRKLKLQMQLSLDGFVARPNGELDWMVWDWDDELKTCVDEITEPVDTIILGRKMVGGFISHWSNVINNPNNPDYTFGKKMVDTPKIVFTKTINKSEWENTVIAKGDLADEISQLKNQEGKDIIVYGGANFVSNLIRHGLIDEYYLFLNPVALGTGMTIFSDIDNRLNLNLLETKDFSCGIALLHYGKKHNNG